MVGVLADIIQVVMLAPCANTLLTVDHTREFGKVTAGIDSALEDGLKLEGGVGLCKIDLRMYCT